MSSRESINCPHCGLALSYTSAEKPNGGVTVYWPPESYEHLETHAGKAKK